MGDIADMMLDGTLCQDCGGYTGEDEAPGYPVLCDECAAEAARAQEAQE